ncbi:MAG TPA: hypothetical protein VG318_18270 [Actinomycetota bacterium]|nr:hypothetical protein [Actinomycetota bacterium]
MRKVLAALLVCLAVLAGSPAHAARQLSAREQPDTQGPLTLSAEQCDEQKLKADGKAVIAVEFCIFFYTFNPLLEIDLWYDYGVAWAQATFDALPGLCTSEVGFYIEVSPGTQIYARTPPEPVSAKKPLPVAVELAATANASAVEEGLVSQEFRLLPGKMRPVPEEEARVGVSWKGRSPAKLAFATGADIAWPTLETPEMSLRADTIRLTSGPGC